MSNKCFVVPLIHSNKNIKLCTKTKNIIVTRPIIYNNNWILPTIIKSYNMFSCTIFSGPLPEKLKIHLNKMSSSQEDNFIIKFPAITA